MTLGARRKRDDEKRQRPQCCYRVRGVRLSQRERCGRADTCASRKTNSRGGGGDVGEKREGRTEEGRGEV